MLPQLNGVAVEFYGLGDVAGSQGTLSAQQVQWLKSFWQGFFDRTGAKRHLPYRHRVRRRLNNGHTVTPLAAAGAPTFVKVSAEQVAFQPDSTTFLDEAAARAALNGLAEQLKGTSAAHYIVAGSTAQVDNASREGAQALSLARAQAVRDVLVEAGVPATDSPAWGWATSRQACAAQMSRRTAAPMLWPIPRPRLRSFWQWVRLRADRQISRAPCTEQSVPGCLLHAKGFSFCRSCVIIQTTRKGTENETYLCIVQCFTPQGDGKKYPPYFASELFSRTNSYPTRGRKVELFRCENLQDRGTNSPPRKGDGNTEKCLERVRARMI